jgi:murein DD-endopeptidase MepM/ murein hydrolase activator NlpD
MFRRRASSPSAVRAKDKPTLKRTAAAPIAARRTVTVGRGAVAAAIVLIGLLAAWAAAMTILALSGDPVARNLMAQLSDVQDKYEQRLQAYRAEIARLTFAMEQSKFDDTSVKGRVVQLGQRLQTLESRLASLLQMENLLNGSPAAGGSSSPKGVAPAEPPPEPPPPPKKTGFDPRFGARIWLVADSDAPSFENPQAPENPELEPVLTALEGRETKDERAELASLSYLAGAARRQTGGLTAAIQTLGLDPAEVSLLAAAHGAVHPPNIVLPVSDETSDFGKTLRAALDDIDASFKARAAVVSLPISRPTVLGVAYSSPFGMRDHPILHQMILHEGLDLAAIEGTPVLAAASGVVIFAGDATGYGNLLEVDHGAGISSRYAHLSEILVTEGQMVTRGQLIAKSGNTGRSTGPHIHFETRVDGVAFDPACFLRAGEAIQPVDATSLPSCDDKPKWPH